MSKLVYTVPKLAVSAIMENMQLPGELPCCYQLYSECPYIRKRNN